MGLIRKTLSISTLGLVNWHSKKERLEAATAELELTRADLEQATEKHALIKDRLEAAERRAKQAELNALSDSRRARRSGRREIASRVGRGQVAAATLRERINPLIDTTRESTRRFAADHEDTVDEMKDRGRKARSEAEKRAKKLRKKAEKSAGSARKRKKAARKGAKAVRKSGKDLRDRALDSAEQAAGTMRERAEELTRT